MDNDYGFSQPSNMAVQKIYIFLATHIQMGHVIRYTQNDPIPVMNSSIHSNTVCASQ